MILKIELENFYSIKDKVILDFRAGHIGSAKARELSDNTFDWNGVKILKSIGLFGANASGKSNIIKAIGFCCRLILDSHLHNEGVIFNFQPFKFDEYSQKPSHFLIDFVCENVEYEYSFSLTRTEIVSESLFYYPNGRRAKIFTRSGADYSFAVGVMSRPMDIVKNTSSKNLFLSRASSMNRQFAQQLYRYFMETFLLGLVNVNDNSIDLYYNNYKSVLLHALSVCDSDICNFEMSKEKVKVRNYIVDEKQPSFAFSDDEVEMVRFKIFHKNNPTLAFDFQTEESDGTRHLFGVLFRLLDVVKNNKSLMLDEFDLKLHTRLADFLLNLIHASTRSQLLFTSHNIKLIDLQRLRRDQIVFVNKKSDASTELFSLYDFKDFRENMDAEKGYLQGRFDAVPMVQSSVSLLKKLLEE